MKTAPVKINQGLLSNGLLFATHNARGRYIGTVTARQPQWLKDNPDKWWSVRDIKEQTVQLGSPVEHENNVGAAPAELNGQTPSRDVPKEGDDDADVVLVDSPAGDSSPPCQQTSLPTPVTVSVTNRSTKAELLPPAKAAMSEAEGLKTETTPLGAMGRKRGRSGGRQIKKQKLPAEAAKAGRMLSPERMRIVLDSLGEYPILSDAASKAGIHRKTLEYWIKRSAAGDAGYDIEWEGFVWRFHEHCKSAMDAADDKLLEAAWDMGMGGPVYKTDPFLLDLGYQGPDAYLRDENGDPVLETVRKGNSKMLMFILEWKRPETYGKHRKRHVPHNGGVLVIGDITKKPKNSSAASIKARKWKSRSRKIEKAKSEQSSGISDGAIEAAMSADSKE